MPGRNLSLWIHYQWPHQRNDWCVSEWILSSILSSIWGSRAPPLTWFMVVLTTSLSRTHGASYWRTIESWLRSPISYRQQIGVNSHNLLQVFVKGGHQNDGWFFSWRVFFNPAITTTTLCLSYRLKPRVHSISKYICRWSIFYLFNNLSIEDMCCRLS